MAEGIRIRSWIFYTSLLVFLAAVVITIALPVTFAKQDEGANRQVFTKRTVYSYRHTEIPRHDPQFSEDPFTTWRVSDKARAAYERMSWMEKIGQTSLFAWGDASGPGGSDGSGWAALIKMNVVGSLINIETFDERVEYQNMVPKNGVPLLFGFDTIHGYKTIFPVNLGMSSTWSPELIKLYASVAAAESGADGVPWTFSPMTDLGRDSRWGRIMEGSGEDPFLSGTLSRAYVEGYQENGVASCIKHFAGYGMVENGLDYTGANIDESQMMNEYMRVYDIALRDEDPNMPHDQQAWTLMGAFNGWDGIPAHTSRKLQTDVLRGLYNFTGFVVADYRGVEEVITHGTAKDCPDAGRQALYAGIDMNMQDGCHNKAFMEIDNSDLEDIKITVNMDLLNSEAPDGRPYSDHVDLAVKRIIAIKDRLGLFEKGMPDEKPTFFKPEHMQASQEVAEKSMILLENKEGTLPMPKSENNRIVVGGRIAGSVMDQVGFWFGRGRDGDAMMAYVRYPWGMADYAEKNNAGQVFNNPGQFFPIDGSSRDKYAYGYQLMFDLQPEAEARGIHDAEKALDLKAHQDFVALLEKQYVEDENGVVPGITHVLAFVGENVTMTGESASRADLVLNRSQLQFLEEIVKVRKDHNDNFKIIEVINAARPLVVSDWERENMDAIVMAWAPGTMAGAALPRVLFGDVDFTGSSSVSFPRSVGQVPCYYSKEIIIRSPDASWEKGGDYMPQIEWGAEYSYQGRYIDSWNSPQYDFGYGLHYSSFAYSTPSITPTETTVAAAADTTIEVKLTITRSGPTMPTAEIIQVYMSPMARKPVPSGKKLVGFQRVEFAAGENTKDVTISIPVYRHFSYFDPQFRRTITPGTYRITVATSANDKDVIKYGDDPDVNYLAFKLN